MAIKGIWKANHWKNIEQISVLLAIAALLVGLSLRGADEHDVAAAALGWRRLVGGIDFLKDRFYSDFKENPKDTVEAWNQ